MSRLILVSNRLPVTVSRTKAGDLAVAPSTGGLASGLSGIRQSSPTIWVGWPGVELTAQECSRLETELRQHEAIPVLLSSEEVDAYYHGVANGVLWPLFHYEIDRIPLKTPDWQPYLDANRRFADAVVAVHQRGDIIWVHDYQLFALPALLRERLPDARIGFFLHIPFPSSEVFALLPWGEQVLKGLLGADLIGLHTPTYLRNFSASLRVKLGFGVDGNEVNTEGRKVRVGVFPLGVDADAIRQLACSPATRESAVLACKRASDEKWLVSIDRLDYTKGIPRRLLAIDTLLERHPEWRERIRFVQVTAPSREAVEAYSRFRREIDELVGNINGRWSTPTWSPVQHIHRTMDIQELASLYLGADVMVVTPIRDGMNLVAKEFVAARGHSDGVLVLSELAGAAAELPDAIIVNPYDVESTADALDRALSMPLCEQRRRMDALTRSVFENTAARWATAFLDALVPQPHTAGPRTDRADLAQPPLPRPGANVSLLLDYDGTLVPFAATPAAAVPDRELLDLLASLAATCAAVHIVSGRPRRFLETHFGNAPVGLHAEHGLWSRAPGARKWECAALLDPSWRDSVRMHLAQFTRSTPGSALEEKDLSFTWHFRLANQPYTDGLDFGSWRARELRLLLDEVLRDAPARAVLGNKVVEVRPVGINKGLAVLHLSRGERDFVVAIGDDTTDEDLFAALPQSAVTIKVGAGETRARFRVRDATDVRGYLREVLEHLTLDSRCPGGEGVGCVESRHAAFSSSAPFQGRSAGGPAALGGQLVRRK